MKHLIWLGIICIYSTKTWAGFPDKIFEYDFSKSPQLKVKTQRQATGKYSPPGILKYNLPGYGSRAIVNIPCSLSTIPKIMLLTLRGSGDNNLIYIRLTDKSGETFRYKLGFILKGEYEIPFELKKTDRRRLYISGGDQNKKLDPPLKMLAIDIANASKWNPKSTPAGMVVLKKLELFGKPLKPGIVKSSAKPQKQLTAIRIGEHSPVTPAHMASADGKVTGQVKVSYDDDYIYFDISVKDKSFNCPRTGSSIYENDGIELFFDCKNNSLRNLNQPDDYQVVATPSTGKNGPPGLQVYRNKKRAYLYADSQVTSKVTQNGYSMKVKLPIDAFEGMRNSSNAIGFGMNLVDNNGKRLEKLFWSGSYPLDYGFLTFGLPSESQINSLKEARNQSRLLLRPKNPNPSKNDYHGDPAIHSVRIVTESPKKYHKVECLVDLSAEYDNPFDFNQISLKAEITEPGGNRVVIDGFINVPYSISFNHKIVGDVIQPTGMPRWLWRYSPRTAGEYKYKVIVTDKKGRAVESPEYAFNVQPSENKGFLRVSSQNRRYLEFDNGDSFFGIGFASHIWRKANVVLYTKHYMNELTAFGGNYTSINLETPSNGGFSLETKKVLEYDLSNAARLDYIIECAERRGIYLLPCLMQTQIAASKRWKSNRYNSDHGGPCRTPEEFFTSVTARKLIKNRLRYTIARWGYSTAILGFEIFNEVNYTDGAKENPASVVKFHRDIANYLHHIDPNRHLIGTCFGSNDACEMPAIWRLKEIDFLVTHSYSKDIAETLFQRLQVKRKYNKPNIGGENGVPAGIGNYLTLDVRGLAIHNNLWASMVAGSAGNVLQWWYGHYGDPLDLYGYHYPQFVRFVKDITFNTSGFIPIKLPIYTNTSSTTSTAKEYPTAIDWDSPYNELQLRADGVWRKIPLEEAKGKTRYVADFDRNVKVNALPGLLREGRTFKWEINVPQKTKVIIDPGAVGRDGTRLTIQVNRKTLNRQFTDSDSKNDPYATELDKPIVIPLRKGKNIIRLSVTGSFLAIRKLRVERFASDKQLANVRTGILRSDDTLIAWIQNTQSTWYKDWRGENVEKIAGAALSIPNISGNWKLEWYDTWEGKYIQTSEIDFSEGNKQIEIPEFSRDIALKMHRLK